MDNKITELIPKRLLPDDTCISSRKDGEYDKADVRFWVACIEKMRDAKEDVNDKIYKVVFSFDEYRNVTGIREAADNALKESIENLPLFQLIIRNNGYCMMNAVSSFTCDEANEKIIVDIYSEAGDILKGIDLSGLTA